LGADWSKGAPAGAHATAHLSAGLGCESCAASSTAVFVPTWNDYDRQKVAELLMHDFPQLGIDKLLAAIRDCAFQVKPSEGWDKLAECTRAHLMKSGGTGGSERLI
jgi:hypothetical protein